MVHSAFGQAGSVAGEVLDEQGDPLIGANVFIEGLSLGAASDIDGRFSINGVPYGSYTLKVSMVGFESASQSISVGAPQATIAPIILKEEVLQSDEVVVIANRREQELISVPVSVAIMAPEELVNRNILSLDDALRQFSGVHVQGNQVSVRGSSGFAYNVGSRVLLLLDGLPLLSPDTDGIPFESLPFAQIERIEVLKGPGSALYGGGALGGVINVVTKRFSDTPETVIRGFAGAYEPVRYAEWRESWDEADDPRPLYGGTVSHSHQVSEKFGFWLNLDFREDASYMRLSEKTLFQGFTKLGWQFNASVRLDLLTSVLWRDKDDFLFWNGARDALQPGSLAISGSDTPSGTNDNRSNRFSIMPSLTHVVDNTLFYQFKARLYGIGLRPIDSRGNPRSYSDGTYGFRYGGEFQMNWNPSPHYYLTTGLSIDANTTHSSFFESADGDLIGSQPEGAAFIQWEQNLTSRLSLTAGLRYDYYSIDASDTVTKLSPKVNLAYAITPGLRLRAAYGEGFRIPSLGERFIEDRDFFPIIRNLDLIPEESTSYEVGLRNLLTFGDSSTSLLFDVAFFWNEFDHLIETAFVPSRSAFQFVNLTSARIQGLESSIESTLFDDAVRLRVGYTYLDAEDLDQDRPLSFRAKHQISSSIDATVWQRIMAGVDFRYLSRPESVNSDFALFVPDAETLIDTQVLDARLGYKAANWRAMFILRNALEYYYMERPALLAPPRHAIIQLEASF
ncbi:MAG: TonB-dependent receptor [Rhodothermaceae bacterium]|nr:TonB-dependent receptor [Rhodothermaceae bacterium]